MNLDVAAYDKQYFFLKALFNDRKRFVAFIGGRRAGKTFIGARAAALKVMECQAPGLGIIISPTYPMSEVPEREFEATGIMEFCVNKNKNERRYEFEVPKGKFTVKILTGEHPDGVRGLGPAWIWIDEGAFISEELWDIILACVLDSKGTIFITTTPKRNWLYERFYTESLNNPEYILISASTYENPILDKADIDSLRSKYSDTFARQEIDAEFVSFEGLVYKFDPRRHIIDPIQIPASAKIWGGLDFGYNDPFVHLWLAYWDGRYYLVDEHYEPGQTFAYHSHLIRSRMFDKNVISRFGDPSEPQAACELARYGIYVVPGKREILPGIQRISKLLETIRTDGKPSLQIFSTCVNTIREFSKYCYSDTARKETPKIGNDHAMDALRYVISSVYVDEDPIQHRMSLIPDNVSPAERRIIESTMMIPESRRTIVHPRKRSVLDSYDDY